MPEKSRDDKEVAPPEFAWVLNKAVQPVQTGSLDPWRAVANSAGMEIKGGTDTKHEACIKQGKVAGHKEFLLRAAEANPDDVRLEFGDGRDEVMLLIKRKIVKRWRDSADDAHPGKFSREPAAKFGGYTLDSAIEEVRNVGEFWAAKNFEHQIGAGDTFH